jgi:hypothetical protein
MKCPLADYWRKRNVEVPMPIKQDKKRCQQLCEYWRDGKCRYKQIIAEEEKKSMRGFAALTKQAIIKTQQKGTIDKETARKAEKTGLRLSGLNNTEQEDYLKISKAYDEELEKAGLEKRTEIEWRIHHWQRFMEDGFSPKEANEKAQRLN